MAHWNNFIKSFRKLKKNFIYIFLSNGLYVFLVVLFYELIQKLLSWQGSNFTQGKSAEEINSFLLSATSEQLEGMLAELKIYLATIFSSYLLYLILIIVLFSLSQALIWHLLMGKKLSKKHFWKWNVFTLIMAPVFLISLFLFLGVKFLILFLIKGINVNVFMTINQIFNLVYLLAFVYFFFILCSRLTLTNEIFISFKRTFGVIKQKFKELSISFLFAFLVAVVLSVISILIFTGIPSLLPYLLYVNLAVVLIFLAWLSIYLADFVN
ncbi:MAG: hypothetical protein KAT77_04435 [Nanoarchaeota archaeon]|nr:hypothetical protein [Nanoarchaeota archaeon]